MSNQLQAWLDAETAQRQRVSNGPGAGVLPMDQALHRSGLEMLQAMLAGELAYPSIGKTLDFLLIEVALGRAVFQGTPGPGHLNPMGSVHGGWYATLLDSALGCCVHSALPAGKAYTTLELKVNLIRAIKPDTQRVRAIGQVIHVGGQTATADARLVGPDGKLYAHGSTTCLVFDPRATSKA
jgi:uncharacterized protein (TIGR00369 family)